MGQHRFHSIARSLASAFALALLLLAPLSDALAQQVGTVTGLPLPR